MGNLGNFSIGRENRENHPKNKKAVLYLTVDGKKIKYGVWKPGCATPKLGLKYIPDEVYAAFKREKELIEAEEIAKGLADY